MAYTTKRGEPDDVTAILDLGDGSDARIERIFVNDTGQEEYRFSWWKDGRIVLRPLDLNEEHLLSLFREGIETGVFRPTLLDGLRAILITEHHQVA
jgi:hypothetical protein